MTPDRHQADMRQAPPLAYTPCQRFKASCASYADGSLRLLCAPECISGFHTAETFHSCPQKRAPKRTPQSFALLSSNGHITGSICGHHASKPLCGQNKRSFYGHRIQSKGNCIKKAKQRGFSVEPQLKVSFICRNTYFCS